jgi:hypothetical protein
MITKVKQTLNHIPLYKILLVATMIYFIGFSVWMVYTSGQPDQAAHTYFSNRYAEVWGIPGEDLQSSYVITGQPYLYYWINGAVLKILRLFDPDRVKINSILIWRLMSVLYSTITVYFLYRIVTKVTEHPYGGVLGAFMLSNTLMFTFISGGISYDNLMNLTSMAAIYHLVSLFKGEDFIRHTGLLGTWLCLGTLSKQQGLLIAALLFIVWLYFIMSNLKSLSFNFKKIHILIACIFLIGLGLFIGLYGVNLVKYQRLNPECEQIKLANVCTRFTEREQYYSPMSIRWLWYSRNEYFYNPFQYSLNFWFIQMQQSIWGIMSHKSFIPMLSVSLHGLLMLFGILCMVRFWKKGEQLQLVLLLVLISYVLFIFLMSYKREIEYNFRHFGIQGRYLFPIIGVLYTLMIDYFLKIKEGFLKRLTLALTIILYFAGGLGMYLFRYSEVFIHWRIFY